MNKAEFKAFIQECLIEVLNSEKEFLNKKLVQKEEPYVDITQLCKHFCICRQTFYNWIKEKKIPKNPNCKYKISAIEDEIKMYPYKFGRNRDYNYRNERVSKEENDNKRSILIESRIKNGVSVQEQDIVFYRKYCVKYGKDNLLDKN